MAVGVGRLWDDVQSTGFHCSQGFDSCTLFSSHFCLVHTPLAGLGHQRGRGVSSESAYTGEFEPSWVVFC